VKPPFSQSSIGSVVDDVDPLDLRPNDVRDSLDATRLDVQRRLISSGVARFTTIRVTVDGVIWDGHHGVRAAAEAGLSISVQVVSGTSTPGTRASILDLPIE
jgi:hypothetical protein